MSVGIQGWHWGEVTMHEKLKVDASVSQLWTLVRPEMPLEHRIFHASRPLLPFISVTTLDEQGRPWSSLITGPPEDPTKPYVKSPTETQLKWDVQCWEGDPFFENMKLFPERKVNVAGLGISFANRRRNKFAGHVTKCEIDGRNVRFQLEVNQAIGNCPKYINIRDLVPCTEPSPEVVYKVPQLSGTDVLPDELVELITSSDTVFIGSSYKANKRDEAKFPSHVGDNARGGRAGFIRVRNDHKTIIVPDFSGNRLLSSLGNIETTPVASLTFVDFETGDILYVTGAARNIVGPEAQAIMPRQNVLTAVAVTGYVFVRDALPVRQRPGTEVERSPYSPPVRLLAEEDVSGSKYFDEDVSATLTSIDIHSRDLATFCWETSQVVHIKPGQTAILDFTPLLGAQKYQHMAALNPSSVNDDRIRTWTVSSAHLSPDGTKTFALTMREKPGGAVTGALFTIARKLQQTRPDLLSDSRPMEVTVKLVGIGGEFALEIPRSRDVPVDIPKQMLWVAGGIGLTPFISMLGALRGLGAEADVVLALSTREPEVLMPLVYSAWGRSPGVRLRVDVFTQKLVPQPAASGGPEATIVVQRHDGRVSREFFAGVDDVRARAAYLCGPPEFEIAALENLRAAGVHPDAVRREKFSY
ncbi:hypothetical protein CERSUDRAFT_104002 [Gelatoporia subvermispora B]|uniref:Uncharacterized protein n=1 Tax=Ceriporiopsis subvermispora (strain B) TaxID=914234 RepID=M2PTT8_CERS8|nr:hypothetical protein CERSUDRAFT_104002 [Gelatoporia subvermispora B]